MTYLSMFMLGVGATLVSLLVLCTITKVFCYFSTLNLSIRSLKQHRDHCQDKNHTIFNNLRDIRKSLEAKETCQKKPTK